MAIDNTDKIDVISINTRTDYVVLTISDHLDWSDEYAHLILLQEKLNHYVAFVESGEIYEVYPKAKGRKIVIQVVKKYSFPEIAEDFMKLAKEAIKDIPMELESTYLMNQ